MIEIKGELFEQTDADAICITTNGAIRNDGCCVMGRGCALEATRRFPGIAKLLGDCIKGGGNHVYCLQLHDPTIPYHIYSFPVKHHWSELADLDLIIQSAREMAIIADVQEYNHVVIPRPGCGNGRLSWDQVKLALREILDDRFYIITWG